jgi:hypothetical protein
MSTVNSVNRSVSWFTVPAGMFPRVTTATVTPGQGMYRSAVRPRLVVKRAPFNRPGPSLAGATIETNEITATRAVLLW